MIVIFDVKIQNELNFFRRFWRDSKESPGSRNKIFLFPRLSLKKYFYLKIGQSYPGAGKRPPHKQTVKFPASSPIIIFQSLVSERRIPAVSCR